MNPVFLLSLLLVWTVPQAGFALGSAKNAESASSAQMVWVTRPDGALSCEAERAESLEKGAADLRKAGVEVLGAQKGSDGLMQIQMCGASQGTHNAYRIRKSDVAKAQALGFTAKN